MRPEERSAVAGLVPVLAVALIIGALLYGTGHELPFVVGNAKEGSTSTHDAVSWLAGVAIVLLIAAPALRFAVARSAQGNWRAAVVATLEQYALSPYLWSRLKALLPEQSTERLADARGAAQRATSVTAGWALASLCAWISALLYWGASFLLVVLALAAALAAWQAAPRAARLRWAYAGAIKTAVELHRLLLFDAAGWRRPRDAKEEREMFEALASGRDEGRYRSTELADAGEVMEIVKRSVGPVVEQSVREAVAGPEFVNFDGVVAARLAETAGPPALEILIGSKAEGFARKARLRVRGGVDADEVPFTVRVESNARGFDRSSFDVTVPQDGNPPNVLQIGLGPAVGSDRGVWVRVLQHERTLQNLELVG